LAVGKGSILRAGNANAATKEKKLVPVQERTVETKDSSAVQLVKESDLTAKVPLDALTAVPKTWGIVVLDENKLKKLQESIRTFGLLIPIVVYKNPKQELLVLKGYHRLEAAKAAKLTEVQVTFVEVKDADEAKAVYKELRSYDKIASKELEKEYEVVSSITVNMPSYLL